MKFVSTEDGLINSTRIVRIAESPPSAEESIGAEYRWRSSVDYLDVNGDAQTTLAFASADEIEYQCGQVIAATPGYFAIDVFFESPHDTYTIPILAWRVNGELLFPISFDPISELSSILRPDGRVARQSEITWASIEQFRAARIIEIQAKRRRETPT